MNPEQFAPQEIESQDELSPEILNLEAKTSNILQKEEERLKRLVEELPQDELHFYTELLDNYRFGRVMQEGFEGWQNEKTE